MYDATYETSSQIIWNVLLRNVDIRLGCYFPHKTSMAEEQAPLSSFNFELVFRYTEAVKRQ